jgi:protein TorT
MAKAAMALRIWISRVSKFARRIGRHYVTACVGTICMIAFCLAVVPVAAAATLAARPQFCVLVPHFKDDYWLSVGFGLEEEAARQDVTLLFYEAGGYRARAAQIAQLETCAARGVDAILLGAVTADHPDLIAAIARVAPRVPVVGLVNALASGALRGRVGVDWYDMGLAAGGHLARLHPAGSAPMSALFLTGPAEAGWTAPLDAGLRAGLGTSSVTVTAILRADTGLRAQLDLVETALMQHPDADYLIGNAPAIEAAFGLFATTGQTARPKLLATYVNHAILRGLQGGQVIAASFDDPVQQGVMAIRVAVRASTATGDAAMTGPDVVLLTGSDQNLGRLRL